jgi:hypothetical protein
VTSYLRYGFTNPLVHKVVDVAGVVHETQAANINEHYPRHTRCLQDWMALEPISSVPGDPPTTCIACLGSHAPAAFTAHVVIGFIARAVK